MSDLSPISKSFPLYFQIIPLIFFNKSQFSHDTELGNDAPIGPLVSVFAADSTALQWLLLCIHILLDERILCSALALK